MAVSTLPSACKGPKLVKDRGYAWVVLLFSFLSHFVHLGFSFAVLGNLTIAHQAFFGISLEQSSWIGSIHTGLFFLLSPIASVLVKKLGCRFSEVLGGVCLILGVGISSVSSETWHAFLLFSVLAAFGISNVYVATSEILVQHFDKRKYLAFSVAVLGYYFGMAAWPTVSQLLLDTYGYSMAMGIMASFHVIHVIAGILFFEPSKAEHPIDNGNSTEIDESVKKVGDTNGLSEEESRDKITAESGTDNQALDVSQMNIDMEKESKLNEPDHNSAGGDDMTAGKLESSDTPVYSTDLKEQFTILLKTPKVWALLINGFFFNFHTTAFLILVNDYILQRTSMVVDEVALGITILGIANIVGCLGVCLAGHVDFDRLILHFFCVLTYGIMTITVAFTNGKVMFYVLVVIWGIAQGASIGNLLGVVYDFCDADKTAVLFSLLLMTEGIGGLIGAPLCGYVGEQTRPEYGIILAGVSAIIASCCVIPVMVHKIREKMRARSNE